MHEKRVKGKRETNIMKNDRHFVKGTIWNTLGSTMYGVNSFVMLAIVSCVGTAEETGYFGIAFTTAQILFIVGLLGTNHYQQTDYHEKYSFDNYKRAKIVACVLMAVGCVSISCIMDFSRIKMLYTVLLTALMMVNAVGDMYQNLFFQKNRLDLSGGALFYRTFWSLLAFIVTVLTTGNIPAAISLQTVVNIMVTAYYVRRYVPGFLSESSIKTKGVGTKQLIAECLPLFVSLLLMNIVINASKYVIEYLMDDESQGYYNMIFIPVQVINLCSQFIFKPLLNQYSKILEERKYKDFYGMMLRQTGLVASFTIICILAAYFLGVPVLGAIYKKDISAYRIALVYVVIGGGIFAVGQLFYYILVILREQKKIMCIYSIGFVVAVVSAYCLVRAMGIDGAALSLILTMTVILLLYTGSLVHTLNWKNHQKRKDY